MIAPHQDNLCMVFAKEPIAGNVMTRLAPALGEEGAMQLYRRLLRHTLQTVAQLEGADRLLYAVPDADHTALAEYAREYDMRLARQQGGDLGARMANAFAEHLPHYKKVVIVGCDCPALTPEHYQRALAALDDEEAVAIPALDGGYVLLGLRRYAPQLFTDIDWGSERVMQQTVERFKRVEFRWQALPPLPDIDRPEDLKYCPQMLIDGVNHEVAG